MVQHASPVWWLPAQAVVALPEHIDVDNAERVGPELVSVINRGAAVLIADMTVTVSCDHAGAEVVAEAFRRAAADGVQLRLVVVAQAVRRVLTLNGLDRLVSFYPSLAEALTAGLDHQDRPAQWREAAVRERELSDKILQGVFRAGLILQAAVDLPPSAAKHIAEAIRLLDEIIQEIRDQAFTTRHSRA